MDARRIEEMDDIDPGRHRGEPGREDALEAELFKQLAGLEQLGVVASLDEKFRQNLEMVTPTLFPRFARSLIREATVDRTGLDFAELTDWRTRNAE